MSSSPESLTSKVAEAIISFEKIHSNKNGVTKITTETNRVLEVHGGGDWCVDSKDDSNTIDTMAFLTVGPSDNLSSADQCDNFLLFVIESKKSRKSTTNISDNFVVGIHCLLLFRVEGNVWEVGHSSVTLIGTAFPTGTVVTNYNVVNCASSSVLIMTMRKPDNEQAGIVYTYVSPRSNAVCYDFGNTPPPALFNQSASFEAVTPVFKNSTVSVEKSNTTDVFGLTTAYEQGVGKGYEAIVTNKEIPNPYTEGDYASAWGYGYNQGKRVGLKPKPQM